MISHADNQMLRAKSGVSRIESSLGGELRKRNAAERHNSYTATQQRDADTLLYFRCGEKPWCASSECDQNCAGWMPAWRDAG